MAFPTTSILDDFNRANEGPPPSANWVNGGFTDYLKVLSNQAITTPAWLGGEMWNTDFGPDCEVYYTIAALNGNTAANIDLFARVQLDGGGVMTDGYAVVWVAGSGNLIIYRTAAWSILKSVTGAQTLADGDSVGMSVVGTTISVYHKPSAGSWTLITTQTDSSVSSAGKIGVYVTAVTTPTNTISIDDFGGGTVGGGGAPVANFSGTPTSGPAPLSVAFTDSSTNTPTSWAWTFGDTNTSTDQNPTHVYTAPGTYTVALTATNGTGSDTETKTNYITVLGAPVVDFSGTPTSGTKPLSVAFTDASTNSPDTWYWDFGDGGSDTTQNPTHIYTVIGVYTVALTASSSAGSGSKTRYAYITVTDIAEVGPAEIENCDIDTGGLAVGLRVADVAIARDNRLGSVTIDASAELRVKDNSYSTLTNNGTLTSLAGDRAVWDTTAFPARHARDIDEATGIYHLVSSATQTYTVSNPSTDRAYDVSALTLNELASVVGTLIADLISKGILA